MAQEDPKRKVGVLTIRSAILFSLLMTLCLVGCASDSPDVRPLDDWPTDGWRTGEPGNHGFDESALAQITDVAVEEWPFLNSLLIIRHGYIVHESYYNGFDASELHDIASVTKSWTSALVGMARAGGELVNLDEPIPDLLPEYFAGGNHDDKREITLKNLLMMRSGIEWDEAALDTGVYGGEELLAQDVTAIALDFPMAHPPGTAWNYSTLDVQLISAIFQHAMGQSLESYAAKRLFDPLGIREYEWLADGMGTTVGGQNLSMTPRDMAKLGLLYLHGGEWEGSQLVPAEWVERSVTPQNSEAYYEPTGKSEVIEWYGYLWWTWEPEWYLGYRAFQARGYAGQQVLVFPELDMIVAATANLEGVTPKESEDQEAEIFACIIEWIFPALTDVEVDGS